MYVVQNNYRSVMLEENTMFTYQSPPQQSVIAGRLKGQRFVSSLFWEFD